MNARTHLTTILMFNTNLPVMSTTS